jgi:hypothetical protein
MSSASVVIAGIPIPDSSLARDATQLVQDVAPPLLYDHSRRVFLWASLQAEQHALDHDAELLYIGAMFHDLGLVEGHRSEDERFEIDGANAARRFLESYGLDEQRVMTVWEAIALHTTPEIPYYKQPEVRLVTQGVEYDVLGLHHADVSPEHREAVLAAHPRIDFKTRIIDAFYEGFKDKPETCFGTMNTDVLAYKDPEYVKPDFCRMILESPFAQ